MRDTWKASTSKNRRKHALNCSCLWIDFPRQRNQKKVKQLMRTDTGLSNGRVHFLMMCSKAMRATASDVPSANGGQQPTFHLRAGVLSQRVRQTHVYTQSILYYCCLAASPFTPLMLARQSLRGHRDIEYSFAVAHYPTLRQKTTG